jgi:hypothetical protein
MVIESLTITVGSEITADEANNIITAQRKTAWMNNKVTKVSIIGAGSYIMIYTDVPSVNEKLLKATVDNTATTK